MYCNSIRQRITTSDFLNCTSPKTCIAPGASQRFNLETYRPRHTHNATVSSSCSHILISFIAKTEIYALSTNVDNRFAATKCCMITHTHLTANLLLKRRRFTCEEDVQNALINRINGHLQRIWRSSILHVNRDLIIAQFCALLDSVTKKKILNQHLEINAINKHRTSFELKNDW